MFFTFFWTNKSSVFTFFRTLRLRRSFDLAPAMQSFMTDKAKP